MKRTSVRLLAVPVLVAMLVVLGALLWLALAHAQWSSSRTSSGAVNSWTASGDFDGDDIPDGSDNCPAWPNTGQALPPWPVTLDGSDPDCDGWSTADENFIGTDPNLACSTDRWPPDFNSDHSVDIFDINIMKPAFFSSAPGPPYDARLDLRPDDDINVLDINRMKPFFFLSCTP